MSPHHKLGTLDLALQESLTATNPREQAMTAIQGWSGYQAPTVIGDAVEPTTERILESAARAGIAILGAANVQLVADAQARWTRFRTNRAATILATPAAAPPAADKFSAWALTGIADSSVGDLGGPG